MRRIAGIAAVAVFLFALYRAATFAVTAQEAITYNRFAAMPVLPFLTAPFHPANQILHTCLVHLVLRVFRLTEFSLRIANLLGFGFYLWAAYRLCTALCPQKNRLLWPYLFFAVNPFTIGWLPESNGIWMGAASVLFALRLLLDARSVIPDLPHCGLLLGLACGFHICYFLPVLTIVLAMLHFNYWGKQGITVKDALDRFILPAALFSFALWILPFSALPRGSLRLPLVLEMDWVVLLPGLFGLFLFAKKRRLWFGFEICLLSAGLLAFSLLGIGFVPNRLESGAEAGMAQITRALRDDIRKQPVRAIQVSVPPALMEPLNFYRKRFALGAVEKASLGHLPAGTDYEITMGPPLQPKGRLIARSGSLALYRRVQ